MCMQKRSRNMALEDVIDAVSLRALTHTHTNTHTNTHNMTLEDVRVG
jgi:hypothetical protein